MKTFFLLLLIQLSSFSLLAITNAAPKSIAEIDRIADTAKSLSLELIQQFKQETDLETRAAIIHALGELRSPVSVQMLVDYIRSDTDDRARRSRYGLTPAVTALITIGPPATPAVIKRLEETTSFRETFSGVRVLLGIYGKEVAKCVVETELATPSGQKSEVQLRKVLKGIDKFPDFEP